MKRINLSHRKRLQLNKTTIAKLVLNANHMMAIASGKKAMYGTSLGAEEPRCTSRPTTGQEDPGLGFLEPFIVY